MADWRPSPRPTHQGYMVVANRFTARGNAFGWVFLVID